MLVKGLPATSRYAARQLGEPEGHTGWDLAQWVALDTRNAIEGLRATVASMASGKSKNTFREWRDYPGYAGMEHAKRKGKLSTLEAMATPITE